MGYINVNTIVELKPEKMKKFVTRNHLKIIIAVASAIAGAVGAQTMTTVNGNFQLHVPWLNSGTDPEIFILNYLYFANYDLPLCYSFTLPELTKLFITYEKISFIPPFAPRYGGAGAQDPAPFTDIYGKFEVMDWPRRWWLRRC